MFYVIVYESFFIWAGRLSIGSGPHTAQTSTRENYCLDHIRLIPVPETTTVWTTYGSYQYQYQRRLLSGDAEALRPPERELVPHVKGIAPRRISKAEQSPAPPDSGGHLFTEGKCRGITSDGA